MCLYIKMFSPPFILLFVFVCRCIYSTEGVEVVHCLWVYNLMWCNVFLLGHCSQVNHNNCSKKHVHGLICWSYHSLRFYFSSESLNTFEVGNLTHANYSDMFRTITMSSAWRCTVKGGSSRLDSKDKSFKIAYTKPLRNA